MSDFTAARRANTARLTDGVRREVVVVQITLGFDGRERVQPLGVGEGAERGDVQHLRLAALEQR